jgi:hypothetical protein
MKLLKIFNTIALGVPVFLACLAVFDEMFIFYAVLSLAFTGFLQTILAAVFWIKNKKNRLIPIYFAVSLLFFLYFFGYKSFDLLDGLEPVFWILPALLTLYLSFIIYTSKDTLSQKEDKG